MRRLRIAIVAGIVGLFGLYLFVGFTEIPVAVICDRGRPNVDLSSTAPGGYFEVHHIGPCVTYTHKSRPAGRISGGGD